MEVQKKKKREAVLIPEEPKIPKHDFSGWSEVEIRTTDGEVFPIVGLVILIE